MTPLLRKMYPDPSMGTTSHGLVVVMNQAFGYLLPSRHPWSRGNTVERWGGRTPVLSLIPQKWLPALNPCASSSHPLCDTPFPNLHLPEHFRGCVCPHIHWVATMSSAPAPWQLPTNQAPSFFSHLHPPVAVFPTARGESWILFLHSGLQIIHAHSCSHSPEIFALQDSLWLNK